MRAEESRPFIANQKSVEVDQGEALLTILLLSSSFHNLSGGAGDTAGLHLEACQGFHGALDSFWHATIA